MADDRPSVQGWGYFKRVAGRGARDAWEYVRHRLVWAILVLLAGAFLGVNVSPLSFAALGLVVVGLLGFFVGRTPAVLARKEREATDKKVRAAEDAASMARGRVSELEAKSVSIAHQHDLQEVARVVIGYVRALQEIRYVEQGGLSPNVAYGFREHFPDLAEDLDEWTEQAKKLIERRDSFAKAVEPKLEALGRELDLPISPGPARYIAQVAESDEHSLVFTEAADVGRDDRYLMLGGSAVASVPIASFDRLDVERRLRAILAEAASDPHRGIVVATRRILEDDQGELESDLTLIADKDAIRRGEGCRLC